MPHSTESKTMMIITEHSRTDAGQNGWAYWHNEQLRMTQGYSQVATVKASWNKDHDLYYYVSWPVGAGWEVDKQRRRIYHPDNIDNRDGHVRAFILAMQDYTKLMNVADWKEYRNAIKLCGCSVQQPKGEYLFFYQYMQMEIKAYEQMAEYLAKNPNQITNTITKLT